jgi:hypothetical protein
MALTIANEFEQAALNAGLALLNSGQFRLTTAANGGGSELALLTFGSTAFAASSGNPASATSNAITKDTSITAGTIAGFDLRTSGAASRINGTVGTSGEDLNVTDNVIPGTATEVTCDAGLTITLSLS